MREIKFRGMDGNGVMKYGRLSQDKENSTAYYKEYSQRICWGDYNIPVSNRTLGQFTGLKDKNGKEIYEGDVVQDGSLEGFAGNFSRWSGIVHWQDEKCCFSVSSTKDIEVEMLSNYCFEEIEVIGNIYENPELLREAK